MYRGPAAALALGGRAQRKAEQGCVHGASVDHWVFCALLAHTLQRSISTVSFLLNALVFSTTRFLLGALLHERAERQRLVVDALAVQVRVDQVLNYSLLGLRHVNRDLAGARVGRRRGLCYGAAGMLGVVWGC